MSERNAMLLVLRELLKTPNQSARELSASVLGEPRTHTRERGAINNALTHLFAIGLVEACVDDSAGAATRRYAVAPGIGAMTIELALAQDLTLWQALLLSSPLGAES